MTFTERVYNRFRRVEQLHPYFLVWEDKRREKEFFKSSSKLSELEEQLKECRKPNDYFQFASDVINPHQHREEIVPFLEYSSAIEPKIVCEIGTASGGTNFLLANALPQVEVVMGLDLFVKNQSILRYLGKNKIKEYYYQNGSSYGHDMIEKVKRFLGERKIDILFIDGDHSYEGFKKDFECYHQFVRKGGIVVFHDIIEDYKTRYGRDTGRYAGGVPKYWNELKEQYSYKEFVKDYDQDGLGIGVLHWDDQR